MLESMMKNKDLKTEMTTIVMYCAAEMLRCYKETRETCTVDENMGVFYYSAGPGGGLGIPCSLSSGFLPHTTYL